VFKRQFNDRTGGRYNNNRFKERFRQYVTECDGDDDNSDLEDAFESLVLDIDPDLDTTSEEAPNTFLTTFGELVPSGATAVSAALANRALTHTLTPGNTT